jgi:hypothetical protein
VSRARVTPKLFCHWQEDSEDSFWATECGNAFQFNDGGPKENKCKFCMYCGGKLSLLKPTKRKGG